MFKHVETRAPMPAAPSHPEALPEEFSPPEVIQGRGDAADWALWDECVAAVDALVARNRAQAAPASPAG